MGTNWNVSYLITVESLTLASYLHVLKSLKLRKQNRGKKKSQSCIVLWLSSGDGSEERSRGTAVKVRGGSIKTQLPRALRVSAAGGLDGLNLAA